MVKLNLQQWRTEGGFGVFKHPPPEILKALQNHAQTQPDCENCQKLLNLGGQHLKMFEKKVSKILKLPRFTIVLH